jgi:hypothetical protein
VLELSPRQGRSQWEITVQGRTEVCARQAEPGRREEIHGGWSRNGGKKRGPYDAPAGRFGVVALRRVGGKGSAVESKKQIQRVGRRDCGRLGNFSVTETADLQRLLKK